MVGLALFFFLDRAYMPRSRLWGTAHTNILVEFWGSVFLRCRDAALVTTSHKNRDLRLLFSETTSWCIELQTAKLLTTRFLKQDAMGSFSPLTLHFFSGFSCRGEKMVFGRQFWSKLFPETENTGWPSHSWPKINWDFCEKSVPRWVITWSSPSTGDSF